MERNDSRATVKKWVWTFLVLPALLGTACQTGPQPVAGGMTEARAEDLLQCNDFDAALAAFRSISTTAERPEERARAYLGIARVHLKMGDPRKALDALYMARRMSDLGPHREMADRLFGQAAFANQDTSVARPYLERSLGLACGLERSRILAQLYICARRGLDNQAADRYLALIPRPFDAEVEEIVRESVEPLPRSTVPSRPLAARMPPPPAPQSPALPLQIIPRQIWGARPVRINIDQMGRIGTLTVHHSGGTTFWGRSASEAADEIRKIQRIHQNENRWADIGYHYIVDRMGRIWEGRPLHYQGAHAHGPANRGNIGIVLLGNFMNQDLNDSQAKALRLLVARLCRAHGIPSQRIFTHGEIRGGQTDCPGPAVSRLVREIRQSLR